MQGVDNPPAPGYNGAVYFRSREEKSTLFLPEREPRKVQGGAAREAEHGLGAEPPSGDFSYRRFRFAPLQAFEAPGGSPCESRWYRVSFCRPWMRAISGDCQNAQTAALFALCRTIFPRNTLGIPSEKWLAQSKNPSLLVISPASRYGLSRGAFLFRRILYVRKMQR